MIGDNIKINRMHLQCQQYQDGQDTNHLPCQPLPGERHRLERPQCLEFVLSWMPLKVYLSPSLFIVLVFVIVSVCLSLFVFQAVHDHDSFSVCSQAFFLSPAHTFWSLFSLARVAEVARGRGGPPPKSLNSDKNFKLEHTLFCRELRFVAIYALFGDLWVKKSLFGWKPVFLGLEMHYYMVYMAYFTELICKFAITHQNDAFVA